MRRLARALLVVGSLALLAVAVVFVTARPGDPALFPARDGDGVTVHLVSHGYHSGLALPREALAEVAGAEGLTALIVVAARFGAYPSLEIGWGEERFYREVPTVAALNWRLALSALFAPGNASVLHVVGLAGDVRGMFPTADIVPLHLSKEGFRRLAAGLDASFAREGVGLPSDLGQGLYGPSLFYRARGSFNLANVCNHWTASMLDRAGVPTAPLLATLPAGLILDLELRSGLRRLGR